MPTIEIGPPDEPRRIHVAIDEGHDTSNVLLLHSSGLSSAQWLPMIDAMFELGEAPRVIAPDFVGSGRSGGLRDGENYSVALDIEVTLASAELADGQLHVFGHSFGGYVALRAVLAGLEPDSLTVYEPVAFGLLDADESRLDEVDHDGRFLDESFGGSMPWLRRFIDFWNGPGAWDALPAARRESLLDHGRIIFEEVRAVSGDTRTADAWSDIACPTLLLRGASSPLEARVITDRLASSIPTSRVVTIPGAGHLGPITHADDVARRFLDHARGPL